MNSLLVFQSILWKWVNRMADYWILFSVYLSIIIFIPIYSFKRKKKLKRMEATMLLLLMLGASGFFLYLLSDFMAVIQHQFITYEGECQIEFHEGKHSGFYAIFDDKSIDFRNSIFPGIKEGEYHCEVRYYPHTEIGYSLKLSDL